jgi:hypothetical protein
MEGAAIVAIALSNGGGRAPNWPDFVGIVLLLLINSAIGFYEERNAGNAVKALMDSLAPKAKVCCDGKWFEIDSADLVPGDMVPSKSATLSLPTAVLPRLSTFPWTRLLSPASLSPRARRTAISVSCEYPPDLNFASLTCTLAARLANRVKPRAR